MSGEDRDLEQPATSRVTDRDLLWVESVSERLLGHSAPRAWERAFFQPEPTQSTPEPETARIAVAVPDTSEAREQAPSDVSRLASSSMTYPVPEPDGPEFLEASDAGRPDETSMDTRVVAAPVVAPPAVAPPVSFGHPAPPSYFAEGDADWRHDLEPEFPDDVDADGEPAAQEASALEPELVIDLTEPVRPQPPEPPPAPGRIDDEILRLALGSGDTVLASAVLLLLEDRSRDRQRLATLETALRALIEQVDRTDGPDHELAVTARLLRRVVEY